MRKIIIPILFFLTFSFTLKAVFNTKSWESVQENIMWEGSIVADSDIKKNQKKLVFRAVLDKPWHVWSQTVAGKDTSNFPTAFNFILGRDTIVHFVKEITKYHEEYDEDVGASLRYFDSEAVFEQLITITSDSDFTINGYIDYQMCDSVKCLFPTFIDFSFEIKGIQGSSNNNEKKYILEENKINDAKPIKDEENSESKNLWMLFFLAFLSGFAALLTPCVFPMIPMTVSFFTKQSTTKAIGIKNALLYGLSIIIIYVLLGTIVTGIFGAAFLNELATGFWANIFFFILILVFAISFLGAFEISLPSSWINKSDKNADRAGLIGIFFMAFTLALVSFSCTGPIVGPLLVQSATVGGLAPIIGMLGFSLALALPFSLFAVFPGWMNSLPQSGGWLNTVKVSLGFLELALALKFLSMADMAINGHFIERELFLAIWIGIFITWTLYLFGFIRLPHDSKVENLSVSRALFGTFVLVFTIYLIPGLWGAPLKLISGFDPPKHNYSEAPLGFGNQVQFTKSEKNPDHSTIGPHGLILFHDLKHGLTYAKENNKPVLLDFTGINCVNCRRMENKVWGEEGVLDILRDKLVIISLEVDNHAVKLPKKDQIIVTNNKGKSKKILTLGDKYGYLQATRYNAQTQPYYRIVKPLKNEKFEDVPIIGSADYEHHGNREDFKNWLEKGLIEYNKLK